MLVSQMPKQNGPTFANPVPLFHFIQTILFWKNKLSCSGSGVKSSPSPYSRFPKSTSLKLTMFSYIFLRGAGISR